MASLHHAIYMACRAFIKTGWKMRNGRLHNDYTLAQRVRYGWGMARACWWILRTQHRLLAQYRK